MEETVKNILDAPDKTEFTQPEANEMYAQYSWNFLIASKEFKYLDGTLSELFLNFSKMLSNRIVEEVDTSKSRLANLSEEEQKEIFNEINLIAEEIKADKENKENKENNA